MTPSRLRQPKGFTLIELMVIILLTGLLATVVSLSLAHSARSAQMEDVLKQIAYRDNLLREYAHRFARPCTLVFQLDEGSIRGESLQDGNSGAQQQLYRLPSRFRMLRLISPASDVRVGELAIRCSAAGRTPTYAVLLEDSKQQRQWLLLAGLSGQSQRVKLDDEIEKLFSELSAARPDSD